MLCHVASPVRLLDVLSPAKAPVGGLVRLHPAFYLGGTFVHWSMTVDRRATGWLTTCHHARVRELLCHALSRFNFVCPAYCFMPDHAHFLFVGCGATSNQKSAVLLLRKSWNAELRTAGFELQKQGFDHVLRDDERAKDAFTLVAQYVFANPVRANLVGEWQLYPFSGAVVPGYPDMDPREDDFWPRFWRVYTRLTGIDLE